MTLLKGDGTAPEKISKVVLTSWPDRLPDGLGLSIKDGWVFGVGFGLAMIIVVLLSSCIIWLGFISIIGSSLEVLFGGA